VLLWPRSDTAVQRVEDVKAGKIGVEYTSWPHYMLETHGIGITAYRDETEIIEAVARGEVAAGMVTDPYLGWVLKGDTQAAGEGAGRCVPRPPPPTLPWLCPEGAPRGGGWGGPPPRPPPAGCGGASGPP